MGKPRKPRPWRETAACHLQPKRGYLAFGITTIAHRRVELETDDLETADDARSLARWLMRAADWLDAQKETKP